MLCAINPVLTTYEVRIYCHLHYLHFTNGETEAELSQASWPQVGTANLQLAPSPGKRGPKGGVLVGKESVARTP